MLLQTVAQLARSNFGAETAFTWCVDDEDSRNFYQSRGGEVIGLKVDSSGLTTTRQTAFSFNLAQLAECGM